MNGLRHGTGIFQAAGAQTSYNGTWRHGQRHGHGELYYDPQTMLGTTETIVVDFIPLIFFSFLCVSVCVGTDGCRYSGEWVENERHGKGRMQYRTGDTYDGSWVHNVRQGVGTMVWAERGEHYTGEFADGVPV